MFIYSIISGIIDYLLVGKTERKLRRNGVVIGKDFYSGPAYFDLKYGSFLRIGDNVRISLGCKILMHDESVRNALGCTTVRRVELGDDIFIGANCIITPGTAIGNHVIIGAGTVVRGSIPDNSVVSGNPCKVVGRTDRVMALHKDALSRMPVIDKSIGSIGVRERSELIRALDNGCAYEL